MNKNLTNKDVKVFELELTGTCNLSCPLCAREFEEMQHIKYSNQRPVEHIISQLEEYPNIEECCIAGHISEPTLYKDLFKLLDYINSRNIKIEFYTNADLHDEQYWREIAHYFKSQDEVYFTVCGSTQELHEKYRVGSKLERVIKHALAFKDECPYKIDYIQHIKFEYNKEDFETDDMKEIIGMFNNKYLINSLQYNNRFKVQDENSDIQMTFDLKEKYDVVAELAKKRMKDGEILCKSLQESFIDIDQYGNVYPCFLYRMNVGGEFNIEDYQSILDGEFDFCYECEKRTISLLDRFGMERIG